MKKEKIKVDADIDTPTKQAPVFSPMRGRLLSPLSSPKKKVRTKGTKTMTPALQEAEAKRLRARKSNATAKIKHRRMVDQHTPNVGSFLSPSSPPKKKVMSSAISVVNDNDDATVNNDELSVHITLMSLTVHIRVHFFQLFRTDTPNL